MSCCFQPDVHLTRLFIYDQLSVGPLSAVLNREDTTGKMLSFSFDHIK